MKISRKLFCKSFLLAFVAFAIVSAVIITSLYLDANAIDPLNEETNMMIGITNNNRLLSICVINFNPHNNSISFLPIPDNVWLENGAVLQNQYTNNDVTDLNDSLESLIGAKINRYMFLSVNNLVQIINKMGQFAMTPQYPFEHNGEIKAGTLNMSGELLKSMFTYDGYDMKTVSVSNIGISYLRTFLDIYTKPLYIDKLSSTLSDKSFMKSINTNLSSDEVKDYCELLSNYSSMLQKNVELSGKYDIQPQSSKYFIPDNPQLNKNIFK